MTDAQSDIDFLKQDQEFLRMPGKIQEWIRESEHATSGFANFFRNGGTINQMSGIRLPYYESTEPPKITVNKEAWERAREPDALESPQRFAFGTLAHEIGHDRYNTGTVPFTGKTADEYVQYRAGLEAQAIFNAFPIFKDLERHPDFKDGFPFGSIGYLQGMELGQMYKQWRNGELDDKTVIDRIATQVPDRPYTLGGPLQDQNADRQLTHRDSYLRDYAQYIAPKLEPHASRNAPSSPADPSHPDHALLEQIRAGVRKVDQAVGKAYDDISERVSRCLLAACKDHRQMYPDARGPSLAAHALNRVDHVVMGTTGNIFAVEGKLDDPAHKRAFVSVETAIRTPVEQSDEILRAANQSIAQERMSVQQPKLATGIDDPAQRASRSAT
ncbi:hypothetical protein ASD78_06735 [Lysobacter sp. Root667]|nr:hypothetical protein ASD78_06735 [Lysobacter sp. Root667]